jgi:hypothetical protein
VDVSCSRAHLWLSFKEEGRSISNYKTIIEELMIWTSQREKYSKISTDTQSNNSSKAEYPFNKQGFSNKQ